MLSATSIPKHDIGNPRSVPVLESTGEAKHSQPFHMYSKKVSASSEEKKIIGSMVQMANLTRKGFEQKDISIVMSPRTVIMWAENYKIIKDIKSSLNFTFLNKCDESEIDIYKEYFQRTFAIDI